MYKPDLSGVFTQRKGAVNRLMNMMTLSGFWALSQLNSQFFGSSMRVIFFRQLRARAMATQKAIVEAAGQRLRAVLLTLLTTITGLLCCCSRLECWASFRSH